MIFTRCQGIRNVPDQQFTKLAKYGDDDKFKKFKLTGITIDADQIKAIPEAELKFGEETFKNI